MSGTQKVAVLGAGRMGAAMVGTLRAAEFDVAVYNRTSDRAEAVAASTGATASESAMDAVSDVAVVISSLADDAAVTEVFGGPRGAADGLAPGTVVLEMSTINPATVHAIRPQVEASGASLVDAPVSGSVPLVESGQLTVMAGGDERAIEAARQVLDALASRVFHVGELGAGATMKLAVNAIVHSLNVAIAEALVLAERSGVDRAKAYEVFAASAAGGPFVQYKRAAFEDPAGTPVAFTLDLVAKDLDLILGLAADVAAPMTQGEANRHIAARAIAAGYGPEDMSAVAEYMRGSKGS